MRLNSYVNYLLDNNPSPFCDYIICKEILKSDAQTVKDSYEWAKRFDLYTEMANEQFPDGSWGDFYPMDTSPAARRKHKVTDRCTIQRLHDLSLDENDEMVSKTLDLCRLIIKGEAPITRDTPHTKTACNVLYGFCPDDPLVAHVKAAKTLTDEKERAYLIYEFDHGPFDVVKICDPVLPDNNYFVYWIFGLERLLHYKYIGEFMAEKVTPFLYGLCDRLCDPDDDIQVATNRYFSKIGQYSESWTNNGIKKKDLLLRIIRILYKVG